jgi:hypothetical protein
MPGYKLGADRRADWTDTVEAGVEAAQPPLLDLGPGIGLLENLPTMAAFHEYAHARLDLAAPIAIVGGTGLLWLVALLYGTPASPRPSPALTVLYGGPDLATQRASLSAWTVASSPHSNREQLPMAWAALLAPHAQAGAPLWEALPAAMAERATSEDMANQDGDPWLAWAGLGLALLLIILALAL